MKIRFNLVLICLAIISIVIVGAIQPKAVSAATASTSIHIIKYDIDGITVLGEDDVTIAEMEAMTVQGDGVTHYYTEGPTFDPNNIWDPDELCPADSLKDKGALQGTALKDLCDLVGGMEPGDTVDVRASDGYGDSFDYNNVYNVLSPELNARQGSMVICWKQDGKYSGSGTGEWTDGMLLAFFPTITSSSPNPQANGKYLFGHQDMHDCLPSHNYHWYYSGNIQYPSTHGLSFKWLSTIKIYKGGNAGWSVALSGARTHTLTKEWFENAIACHTPELNPLAFTYLDNAGNTWSGLPLWYVCGIVDDTNNIHGAGCFNDSLYYNVKVTGGADNYNFTFSSTQIARNDGIILANKVKLPGETEFHELPADKYPLKLVSSEFTVGGPSVAQIKKIELLSIGTTPPPTTTTTTPGTANWPLQLVGAISQNMTKATFESGLGCHAPVTYQDEDGNVWSGFPLWMLVARVDDSNVHGTGCFNDTLAATNYEIKVIAADNYSYSFYSQDVARNDGIIVANKIKLAGTSEFVDLPATMLGGSPPSQHPAFPLKITGPDTDSGQRIGAVVKIQLMISTTPTNPAWDFNGNHTCDIGDVVIIGNHWGETGAAGWIPQDLNNNGIIDIGDVVVLGNHWGETW